VKKSLLFAPNIRIFLAILTTIVKLKTYGHREQTRDFFTSVLNYQDSLTHAKYELILSEIRLKNLIFKTEQRLRFLRGL